MRSGFHFFFSRATVALLVTGACATAIAQQHAHTHGRLALNVAVDARSITIGMEAPLDNFLGFERAPRTDAERQRVAEMSARLQAADTLFVPDPAAGCRLAKVELASAVLGIGDKAAVASPDPSGKKAEAHADIDISIQFDCQHTSRARHMDVKLFDAFKRLKTIDAQVATEQGQFKRVLAPAAHRLAWGK